MQELDEAARRRLPKQLYIPLPCAAARRLMLDRALGAVTCNVQSFVLVIRRYRVEGPALNGKASRHVISVKSSGARYLLDICTVSVWYG